MTYTKNSPEWSFIRQNSGHWFDKESMRFWGSKIYWNTLSEIDGDWVFITQEDNFDKSQKLFSIRLITRKFDFETLSWQQHATLAECKQDLKKIKEQKNWLS